MAAPGRVAPTPAKNKATPANDLLERHGADAMLEAGDLDGSAMWKRIQRAVEDLQRAGPKSGEAVH